MESRTHVPTMTTPATQPPVSASVSASGSAPAPAAIGAKRRITGLDALRGLAALTVVLGHFTANYNRVYGHSADLLFSYPWAGYGVLLFFMISGFVILMTAERAARPGDFAWARFSRLYPAYWTALIVTLVVLTSFGLPGRQPSVPRAAANVLMFQNLLGVGNVDSVYWTLHVELYFYAIMLVLIWRGWVRHTEFVLLGLVALGMADRLFFQHVTAVWAERLRDVLIVDHAFAFLIGVVLYRSLKGWRAWHPAMLVVCLVYAFFFDPWPDVYVTAAFIALLFLTTRGYLKPLEWRPLIFLGTVSYSLYLTHQNIGYVIIRAGYAAGLGANVSVALAVLATLLIASAVAFLVECPAMEYLRHRRPAFLGGPSRRPQPAPATAPVAPIAPGAPATVPLVVAARVTA